MILIINVGCQTSREFKLTIPELTPNTRPLLEEVPELTEVTELTEDKFVQIIQIVNRNTLKLTGYIEYLEFFITSIQQYYLEIIHSLF